MNKNAIVAGSIACGLFLSLASCINEDYSFEKEVDMNVQVGTNFSLPIGTTDTIRLGKVIPESDMLKIVDGSYVIATGDRIAEDVEGIESIVFEDFIPQMEPYVREFDFATNEDIPNIPGLDYPDIEVKYELDVSVHEEFDVKEEIPSEVKSVKYVKVDDGNGNPVEAQLTLNIAGVPSFVPKLHLVAAEASFPEIIDFEVKEEEGECFKKGSSIFFSQDIILTNGAGRMSIPVIVKGIQNPKIENGMLILTDAVEFKGSFYVDEEHVPLEEVLEFKHVKVEITPSLELPTSKLRVTEASGTIEPVADISTSVSLSDLPDFLQGEEIHIGLKDMSLELSVNNPINATIEADIVLSAKDAQGQVIDGKQVMLSLEVAPNGRTNFLINKSSDVITSGSLVDLLSVVPDRVDLEVTRLVVDCKTDDQLIDLTQSKYHLEVNYDLQIPLEFDNLQLSYTETITGLQDDLKDVVKWIDCLEVHANVVHTIPANLSLKVYPRNAMGEDIEGIDFPEELFVKAAPDSEGTECIDTIEIKLEETRDGALEELDQLYLEIEVANADNQDLMLSPDQYIVLKMSAKLPKGINIDLNELNK